MYDAFANREAASEAAAEIIDAALLRRLEAAKEATLVVSGGSTPLGTFERLAANDALPWERVHVTLSDERWVPPSHPDSNERMLRETLLTGAAARAKFLPLHAAGRTTEEGSELLDTALRSLPFPFACSLLGMGEDGHFASLFPDAANLAAAVDVDDGRLAVPVDTAHSPHRRISLTLSALSRCDEIVLLIFGEAKRDVLERAAESAEAYPVSYLLRQKRAPVRVLWSP